MFQQAGIELLGHLYGFTHPSCQHQLLYSCYTTQMVSNTCLSVTLWLSRPQGQRSTSIMTRSSHRTRQGSKSGFGCSGTPSTLHLSAGVQQLTLSVFYGGLVLLYFGLCRPGEGCCCGTVPMMHQVAGDHTEDKTCPS